MWGNDVEQGGGGKAVVASTSKFNFAEDAGRKGTSSKGARIGGASRSNATTTFNAAYEQSYEHPRTRPYYTRTHPRNHVFLCAERTRAT